jgi:PhnB protein
MQMNPYLSFKGECEAAFKFYERCLGGQSGTIFRYAGTPLADSVPADWSDKVMHGSLTLGGTVLMGGDVAPDAYEEPKGFSLSLHFKGIAETERVRTNAYGRMKPGAIASPVLHKVNSCGL